MAETKGAPDALADTRVSDSTDEIGVTADTVESSSLDVAGFTMADMLGSLAGLLEAVAHTPDVEPPMSLESGTVIDDKYRVDEEIGIGGMGVVYRARDLHLSRDIAVKLHGRLSHEDSYHRLSREATAMAQLSHPNVVTVHSVGDVDGQLFIAMELVDGGTMSSWLNDEPREWSEVLDMFLRAGEGLSAAHAVGLVHRDFKPDNILISKDGQVRVADFGLARAVEAGSAAVEDTVSLTDSTEAFQDKLTQTGAFLGTPAYMAPEQFDHVEVDARADQFAFCVALYEGLYGERPFSSVRVKELRAQIEAGEIREEPEGVSVPRWIRDIVLRGLSADPAHRFSSMRGLLSLLRADPTARRRRWIATTAGCAIVVAALVAALLIGRSQARATGPACAAGPERAAAAWNDERRAAVRESFTKVGGEYAAQALDRVEILLDEYRDQWSATWVQTCETAADGARSDDLLDHTMVCLDRAIASFESLVGIFSQADRNVVGRSVTAVRAMPRVGFCADADAMLATVQPPSELALEAEVASIRTRIDTTHAYFDAGAFKLGYPSAKEILADAKAAGYEPLIAEAMLLVGKFALEVGEFEAAEKYLSDAFFVARGEDYDRVAAHSASFLVYVVGYAGGRYEPGYNWSRHAGAELSRLGSDAARTEIQLLLNVAAMDDRHGKLDEALAAITRGKLLSRELYGEDGVHMARLLTNETAVLHAQGKLREAHSAGVRAIALYERVYGDKHPLLGTVLSNVGLVATDRGMHDEAIALQKRALTSTSRHMGADSVDAGYAQLNLGVAIHHAGRPADAIVHYDEALRIVTAALGPEHPDVGLVLNSLGVAYEGLQRYDDAIVHVQRAIDVMQPGSAELPIAVSNLAGLYMRAHKPEQAKVRLLEALEMSDRIAPNSVTAMLTLIDLAKVHIVLEQPDAAFPYIDRAQGIAEAAGVDPHKVSLIEFTRAQALWDSNRDRRGAVALARKALAGSKGADQSVIDKIEHWLEPRGGARP
jgi:tetratricopeptide (TPR) repeat protein/tRNA A-37 threonylcarbamoyl transferase component Bud32